METLIEKGFNREATDNGVTIYELPGPNGDILILGGIDLVLSKGKVPFLEYIEKLKKMFDQKYILLDFHNYANYIKVIKRNIDGEKIMSWKEYRSSNGSKMIISIINIR